MYVVLFETLEGSYGVDYWQVDTVFGPFATLEAAQQWATEGETEEGERYRVRKVHSTGVDQ